MGKVTADQILAEAKTLSRDEQEQLRDTLDAWLRSEHPEEQLERLLYDAGLLRDIRATGAATAFSLPCADTRLGDIAATDVAAALAQFRQDLAGLYRLIEITPALVTRAMAFGETYALSGYDAVQLAAAVEIHTRGETLGLPVLTLVSADEDLNVAATAGGLAVENPNRY